VETGAEAGADPARTAGAEIGAGIPDAAEAAQGWTPMDSKGRKLNGGDPPWREHPTEDSEASDFAVEFIQKEKKKKKKKKKKKEMHAKNWHWPRTDLDASEKNGTTSDNTADSSTDEPATPPRPTRYALNKPWLSKRSKRPKQCTAMMTRMHAATLALEAQLAGAVSTAPQGPFGPSA